MKRIVLTATALLVAMSSSALASGCIADASGKAPINAATIDQFTDPNGQVHWDHLAAGLLSVPAVAACLNGRTPDQFLKDLVVNNDGVLEQSTIPAGNLHAALAKQQGIYLFKATAASSRSTTRVQPAKPAAPIRTQPQRWDLGEMEILSIKKTGD